MDETKERFSLLEQKEKVVRKLKSPFASTGASHLSPSVSSEQSPEERLWSAGKKTGLPSRRT